MNELARVVRRELDEHGGGMMYGDTSGGYDMRGEYEQTPRPVGFTIPDTPGMQR